MHRDGDGSSWVAFHADMRRRTWWQLMVLDGLLSTDRGSEPLIRDGSFTTRRPLHINDADVSIQSPFPVQERIQMAEMALPLIYMEGLHTLKIINLSRASVEARSNLASSFLEKLEGRYFAKSDRDLSDTNTWLIYTSGQLLSLMMWLAVQYPLHRRIEEGHDMTKRLALRTSLALLTMRQRTEEARLAIPFLWWFRMLEPWHALAIALSIVCSESDVDVIQSAWPTIRQAYARCSKRYSGEGHGDVWRPLQALMVKTESRHNHVSPQASGETPKEQHQRLPEMPSEIVPPTAHPLLSNPQQEPIDSAFNVDFGEGADTLLQSAPWTVQGLASIASDEDPAWEEWNKFVDDLGCLDETGSSYMTSAWLIPDH